MDIAALLQLQFNNAHGLLEAVMSDLTPEAARYVPPGGIVATIGGQYLHILTIEDLIMQTILKGVAPLYTTTFLGKIGSDEVPQFAVWGEWGRTADVDLAKAREYGKAVYAETDRYLSRMTPDALESPFDLSLMGLGMSTRAGVISAALNNIHIHTGEISAIKGLQGLKGYPI